MNTPKHAGCKVAGCTNPHRARGLCRTHYARFHRTGSPYGDGRLTRTAPTTPVTRRRAADDVAVADALDAGGTLTLTQYHQIRSAS